MSPKQTSQESVQSHIPKTHSQEHWGKREKSSGEASQESKQKELSGLKNLSTHISRTHLCSLLQLVPLASLSQKMIYRKLSVGHSIYRRPGSGIEAAPPGAQVMLRGELAVPVEAGLGPWTHPAENRFQTHDRPSPGLPLRADVSLPSGTDLL